MEITIFYGGRGLWGHIETTDGEQIKEGGEKSKWVQEDMSVLGALQTSLEASILEAYSYCETTKELWDTLKTVYGDVSNFTRVFEVKQAINNLSQEDMDFKKHFGKFRSLWAELEMLRPSTVDPTTLNERREHDKVFGLLLTLNPAYNDLIKHILRAKTLPRLDEVCSQLQKEQGSSSLFGGKEVLPMANKGVYKHDDVRALVCDHCKRKGHMKDKCWILHPHLKPNKFKDSPRRANLASEDGVAEASTNASTTFKKSDLEVLLQSIASKPHSDISLYTHQPSTSLVVVSGASHHMISNPNLLSNIRPSLGNVSIANGDKLSIEGIGNLNLFSKPSKTFYMPKFTSNLLSVKRTTKDLDCLAIFSPNDVKFQDIKTGKVFVQGGTKDDLYVLGDTSDLSQVVSLNSAICANSASTLNVIWHARLGHPHTRALEMILPDMTFDSSSCEACILGKHCKTVFPKSNTVYEHCFDLIHSDV